MFSHALRYHRTSRDPALVALAVAPLWAVYALGVRYYADTTLSGVDPATLPLAQAWGWDMHTAVHGTVIALIALVAFALLKRRRITSKQVGLSSVALVAESFAYAAALGATILLVMDQAQLVAIGLSTTPLDSTSPTEAMVLSAGAGLYEEFFFRLLLIVPLAVLLAKTLAMPRPMALGLAIIGGSLLFAAAHHVIGTEPWDSYVFMYRSVAGVLFGALLLIRGFAVCAWTHASYDFLLLL